MKITIVADNPSSWIMPYIEQLVQLLKKKKHKVDVVSSHRKICYGDLALFLGCEQIAKPKILARNAHNLVVHESALPKGRGMSPLTWQIIEGKNTIPITLFEITEGGIDSGDIYLQNTMKFEGHELVDELREEQGKKTIDLILKFVERHPNISGQAQKSRASYYKRRGPKDSELDPNKTIAEQFNFLRVVDNERYPAFFTYRGKKYFLHIYKKK
jgi:methionyl-tRNA formyltransferase|tara:strand:+ start:1169 stop:1810 length:642 start_codon:yes stop_codon:yes gene_type:complete